jgi:hypothetical protein
LVKCQCDVGNAGKEETFFLFRPSHMTMMVCGWAVFESITRTSGYVSIKFYRLKHNPSWEQANKRHCQRTDRSVTSSRSKCSIFRMKRNGIDRIYHISDSMTFESTFFPQCGSSQIYQKFDRGPTFDRSNGNGIRIWKKS